MSNDPSNRPPRRPNQMWTVAFARELVVSLAVRALLWCADLALH